MFRGLVSNLIYNESLINKLFNNIWGHSSAAM